MYNTSNPAELYPSTTWELLATDKYLKTTTGTPLSSGGSNSFTIQKANLPATALKVNTFSLTTQKHTHTFQIRMDADEGGGGPYYGTPGNGHYGSIKTSSPTSEAGGGNTGTASPYTENLGSGTAISVNPTYITIKAWKRLS